MKGSSVARGVRLGDDVFMRELKVLAQVIGLRWNADGPQICVKFRHQNRVKTPWVDPKLVRKL